MFIQFFPNFSNECPFLGRGSSFEGGARLIIRGGALIRLNTVLRETFHFAKIYYNAIVSS